MEEGFFGLFIDSFGLNQMHRDCENSETNETGLGVELPDWNRGLHQHVCRLKSLEFCSWFLYRSRKI